MNVTTSYIYYVCVRTKEVGASFEWKSSGWRLQLISAAFWSSHKSQQPPQRATGLHPAPHPPAAMVAAQDITDPAEETKIYSQDAIDPIYCLPTVDSR